MQVGRAGLGREEPLHPPSSVASAPVHVTALSCPACGQATAQRFLFRLHGADILQCKACGLGRTEAVGFDPDIYYAEPYFSGGHGDGYSDYLGAEPVLRREFAGTVDYLRRFQRDGKLLEIGCAYGFFLQEAARYFEVAGVELAEHAVAHCRRTGLNVRHGTADAALLQQTGRADAIVLLDVVEHLPQPRETLALCEHYLNPGGVILITTGDFGSLLARLAGVKWRLMTPPQHLWFFTAESMRRLASVLGLVVERVDHPWKIVPLSLIAFQLRRMVGFAGKSVASASRIGVPVNLFDAMRLVLRKPHR
jgi:SAM-dependent methyltransferase